VSCRLKARKKIENKSGMKQPRPNDIETEIESAPDSIFVNQTPTKVNSQPPSSKTKTPFKTPSKSSFVTPKSKKKKISTSLEMQLPQIYGQKRKKISIKFLIFNNKIIV
jgi:hypothetical protein